MKCLFGFSLLILTAFSRKLKQGEKGAISLNVYPVSVSFKTIFYAIFGLIICLNPLV